MEGDSESLSADVEGGSVAEDINGKPVDVVGLSVSDTKSGALLGSCSVSVSIL